MVPRRSLDDASGTGRKNIIVAFLQLQEISPVYCVIACQAKFRSKYSSLADSVNQKKKKNIFPNISYNCAFINLNIERFEYLKPL